MRAPSLWEHNMCGCCVPFLVREGANRPPCRHGPGADPESLCDPESCQRKGAAAYRRRSPGHPGSWYRKIPPLTEVSKVRSLGVVFCLSFEDDRVIAYLVISLLRCFKMTSRDGANALCASQVTCDILGMLVPVHGDKGWREPVCV